MFTDAAPGAFLRAAAATTAASALLLTLLSAAGPTAQADTAVAPKSGSITLDGAGWGHGKGMSQWGAYGAASKGLGYDEILGFYYPGTTLDKLADGNTVRVLISADTDKILHFRPVKGITVTDSAGKKVTLPYGSKYTKWEIKRSGSKRVLAYRNTSGKYVTYATKLNPVRVWYAANPSTGTMKLAMPDGSTRTYRGKLALRFSGSGAKTVNYVAMESYLRGVVPAEMPGSWAAEALKAQSVAARTYSARLRSAVADNAIYDLCDTSACQVYKGTSAEYSATDKAISATANKVVEYKGKLALTMFSASNGGWSASGGSDYPYLKAQKDPYDGVKRDQTWTVTLSASKIQKAYSSIGTLKSVQVTDRDGDGTYGGRVEKVKITGSKGSVTVSGGSFKSTFGLKERLFKVTGSTTSVNVVTTSTPTASATATSTATPSATATPTATATATSTGTLTGAVLKAYTALSKTDAATLGAPKTGVKTTSSGTYADFALGRITCPTGKACVVSFG